MSRARTVVFDTEAVQALADQAHPKHRRVITAVTIVARWNKRRAGSARLVVPTSVRVEAGWRRQAPTSASLNQLGLHDAPLDTRTADRAAHFSVMLRLSVADAHLAAVVEATDGPHVVFTSDVGDLRRIAKRLDRPIEIVAV
jgi:predicted nucleic acid-binding protein